jgi:hypothetical protein
MTSQHMPARKELKMFSSFSTTGLNGKQVTTVHETKLKENSYEKVMWPVVPRSEDKSDHVIIDTQRPSP